jgi:hypothetical protein
VILTFDSKDKEGEGKKFSFVVIPHLIWKVNAQPSEQSNVGKLEVIQREYAKWKAEFETMRNKLDGESRRGRDTRNSKRRGRGSFSRPRSRSRKWRISGQTPEEPRSDHEEMNPKQGNGKTELRQCGPHSIKQGGKPTPYGTSNQPTNQPTNQPERMGGSP